MSTCSICVEDARNPVCCVPCGHVYCRICVDKWQKRSKNNESECPECREKIQDVLSIYIRKDDSKDLYCKKILAEKTKLQHDLQNNLEKKKQLEYDLSSYKKRLAKQNRTGKQMENGNPELKTNDEEMLKELVLENGKVRMNKRKCSCCTIFGVIVLPYIALLFVISNYGFGLFMNISVTTSLGNMAAYILATLYFILKVVVSLVLILIGMWVLWRILRWMIGRVLEFLIIFVGTYAMIKLFKDIARQEKQNTKREYISQVDDAEN